MKDFPVRVDLMCRFRTPAQQRDTIQNLKRGLVDIVVGTCLLYTSPDGGEIHYIGGSDILPAPLEADDEARAIDVYKRQGQ